MTKDENIANFHRQMFEATFRHRLEQAIRENDKNTTFEIFEQARLLKIRIGKLTDQKNDSIFGAVSRVTDLEFFVKIMQFFKIKNLRDLEKKNASLVMAFTRQSKHAILEHMFKSIKYTEKYDILGADGGILIVALKRATPPTVRAVASLIKDGDKRFLRAVVRSDWSSIDTLFEALSPPNQKILADFLRSSLQETPLVSAFLSKNDLLKNVELPLGPPRKKGLL